MKRSRLLVGAVATGLAATVIPAPGTRAMTYATSRVILELPHRILQTRMMRSRALCKACSCPRAC